MENSSALEIVLAIIVVAVGCCALYKQFMAVMRLPKDCDQPFDEELMKEIEKI